MLGMEMPQGDYSHAVLEEQATIEQLKAMKKEQGESPKLASVQPEEGIQQVEALEKAEKTHVSSNETQKAFNAESSVILPLTNGAAQDSASKTLTPLIKEQLKTCAFILKGLKRHPQAGPFLVPVDPVALGIPDYPTVVKNPMDLSTIQSKLDASEYESAEQFATDVRLMLDNCFAYNAPETQVYAMGKTIGKYFNSAFAKLPTELSAVQQDDFGKRRKSELPSPAPRPKRDSITPRRTSVIPAAPSSGRAKRLAPELNFCMATWKELTKKSLFHISWPFLEPVDHIKLGIPDYPTIITHSMDLSTIKKKLDVGQYATADEFEADMRLMFNNCYTYNGLESDVSKLGKELEQIFDKKWTSRPNASSAIVDYDDDSEKILALNKQIQALQQELNELLMKRRGSGTSQAPKAAPKPRTKSVAPSAEPAVPSANTPMTFEEKRQLSVDVNNLSPEKLGRVVEIIHNSMPYLQQQSADSDVIELDIESLDVGTLRQLQKYINECKGAAVKKRKMSSVPASRPKKQSVSGGKPAAATTEAQPTTILEEALSSDDSSSSDDDLS